MKNKHTVLVFVVASTMNENVSYDWMSLTYNY